MGRDTEIAVLDDALAKARSGSGQVVGVVAEAGTGKSRLCAEFLDGCRVKGIPVLEGWGVAHGKSIPMLPMLQLWRALFDIVETDAPEAVRAKIAGRLLLMDEAFRESLPLLFDLFGVPDPANPSPALDPEVRQRRLHGVIKRFMNDPAFGAGVRVYLLEDLHWFDGASDAFLETIIESVPGTHHLWIVNFRPEYRAGWLQRSYYQHLSLQPLTTEAIRALLRDHLGNHPSTATLPELIHDKTRGNPFFIEEVVQSLVENGHLAGTRGDYRLTTPVTALQVPPTVQALLAARIDRLGESEKQVLQTASIIGKTFPEALLRRVLERVSGLGEAELGASLSKLVTAEFLFESALYPVLEYSFKHPLTQEVAQGSQLRERRNRLHAAVAEVLEGTDGNLDERAAEIAQHWAEAGESAHAAGWYGRAAAWAGQSNLRQALEHWRRVRELAPAIETTEERDALAVSACVEILTVGWRMGGSDEEMESVFAEGRALAERTGDRRTLASLLGIYGLARLSLGGSGTDYLRCAEEAAQIAEQFDDPVLRAASFIWKAWANYHMGYGRAVLTCAARVLNEVGSDNRMGAEIGGQRLRFRALLNRAMGFLFLGQLDDSEREFDEVIRVAEVVSDLDLLSWAFAFRANLGMARGDDRTVLELARRALEIAEARNDEGSRLFALCAMARGYLLKRMFTEARDAMQECNAIINAGHFGRYLLAGNLSVLSDAHRALGEIQAAVSTAREGVQRGEADEFPYWEAVAQIALAAALTARGEPLAHAEIESALARAEHLVEVTEGHSLTPQILEARGRLAAKLDDSVASTRLLREALAVYHEIGATGHAARLAKELDA